MKRKKNREKRQQRAKDRKILKAYMFWQRVELGPEVEPIIYLTCEETKRRFPRLELIMNKLREQKEEAEKERLFWERLKLIPDGKPMTHILNRKYILPPKYKMFGE